MSLDDLQAQLRGTLDQQFAALKQKYDEGVAEARQQAVIEAERDAATKVEHVRAEFATARAEWDARMRSAAAAVVAARTEAEQHRAALEAARAEVEHQHSAVMAARAEVEQAMGVATAARAEIEQQMNVATAARAEADNRVAEAAATRAEAERTAADAARRANEAQQAAHADQQAAQQAEQQANDAAQRAVDAEHRAAAADQRTAEATQRAAEAIQRAAEMIQREREAQQHKLDQAATQAAAAARRAGELELESERRRLQSEGEAARLQAEAAADAARRHAEAEIGAARQQAQTEAEAERQRAQAEIEAVREQAQTEAEAERQRAAAEIEAVRQQAQTAAEADRQRVQAEIEAAREQVRTEAEAERQRAQAEIESLRQRMQTELAAAQQAVAPAAATATAPAAAAPEVSVAALERLVAATRHIDGATTLSQALDALLTYASAAAGRAAIFLINADRLKAWKGAGIPDVDVQTVESSISGRDLLARAIQTGQATPSSNGLPAPPFARLPADRVGLAVPVMIGGRAVAVVYADSGSTPQPPGAFEAVEALVRHAAAIVALRTAMRTLDMLAAPNGGDASGGGEVNDVQGARRYARLLVSEIKLYNEAAVRAGREQRDLLQRLRAEIDRAQKLYEERVPAAVGGRHAYFHQELIQTLADGDAALLGAPQ